MGILVKFELLVKQNKEDELIEFFSGILQGTKDFPGNQGVKLTRSLDDQSSFTLIEYWKGKRYFSN